MLFGKVNGELNEDTKHNSTTSKYEEVPIRFYYTTEILKILGPKSSQLMDKFCEILGLFMARSDFDVE